MRRGLFAIPSLVALGLVSACGGEDPLAAETPTDTDGDSLVVGSANFSEQVVLGEIYAGALENAGFDVERNLNIGAREVLYSQVENCSLHVVPEYNQALLAFVEPDTSVDDTASTQAALDEVLPDSLEILEPSEAQNNNAVGVREETAEEYGLESIPDLAEHAPELVFGGATEWEARADGYLGLREQYGVEFAEYRALDYSGPITLSALESGDIDAALLFSTVPQIETEDYVILEDPENVIGVNNITPLLCADNVPEDAREVLNNISAALTTEELSALNAEHELNHRDAADVSSEWLEDKEL